VTSPIALDRLLRRRPIADVLAALTVGESYEIDAGTLRIGRPSPHDAGQPIEVEGETIATVVGRDAERVAEVLSAVAAIETERRRLADEVLGLYREVNLMYALADRLAGAIDSRQLAQRMIAEATRLVPADAALVLIDGAAERITEFGDGDVLAEPTELDRARIEVTDDHSTLVAPLSVDETERGAIVLARRQRSFSAGDLKLVSTVASQGAALVDRVLEGERRQVAAERREQRLREQIDQLRVALDASRRPEEGDADLGGHHVPELRARIEALREIVRSATDDEPE
jgi:hypothetical protein